VDPSFHHPPTPINYPNPKPCHQPRPRKSRLQVGMTVVSAQLLTKNLIQDVPPHDLELDLTEVTAPTRAEAVASLSIPSNNPSLVEINSTMNQELQGGNSSNQSPVLPFSDRATIGSEVSRLRQQLNSSAQVSRIVTRVSRLLTYVTNGRDCQSSSLSRKN
jgi:hypothetical protein